MIELTWKQPQLESSNPQILEDFDGYEIINVLDNSQEYSNKYQIWNELVRLLSLVKNKEEVVAYLRIKLQ